jgi:putative redox protein
MDAKVTWKERLSFTGEADTGIEIPLGANVDVGGDGDGVRPMELFAIGLAGCTAMDVISILQKKRQDIDAYKVEVHMERADEHPKVFTEAEIVYLITGKNVQEKAVLRAIELSANRYCPAQAMLGQLLPITIRYKIFENSGDGKSELVVSDTYEVELEV